MNPHRFLEQKCLKVYEKEKVVLRNYRALYAVQFCCSVRHDCCVVSHFAIDGRTCSLPPSSRRTCAKHFATTLSHEGRLFVKWNTLRANDSSGVWYSTDRKKKLLGRKKFCCFPGKNENEKKNRHSSAPKSLPKNQYRKEAAYYHHTMVGAFRTALHLAPPKVT